jgi:dTDP-4-dehydrorhamnose 3,5-epimerase
MSNYVPRIYVGGRFVDDRGSLEYFNDFLFGRIKRFYKISHNSKEVVRAWQGHKFETKWFYVINGAFMFHIIKLNEWSDSAKEIDRYEFILNANDPQILEIPGGYLNGFVSIEDNSQVIVYSDFTLDQSNNDDFRFSPLLWNKWNK